MRSDPLAKSKLRPNVRPRCPQATRMCGVVMVMGLPAKDVTLPSSTLPSARSTSGACSDTSTGRWDSTFLSDNLLY